MTRRKPLSLEEARSIAGSWMAAKKADPRLRKTPKVIEAYRVIGAHTAATTPLSAKAAGGRAAAAAGTAKAARQRAAVVHNRSAGAKLAALELLLPRNGPYRLHVRHLTHRTTGARWTVVHLDHDRKYRYRVQRGVAQVAPLKPTGDFRPLSPAEIRTLPAIIQQFLAGMGAESQHL